MSYTHAAAALIAAALAAAASWQVQAWRYGEQIASIRAEAAESTARAEKAAQMVRDTRQQEVTRATQNAARRAQIARADADNARAELDRLRDDLRASAVPASGDACTAADQRATTLAELFGQCAGAYTSLARTADGHSNDVKTLIDAWPKQ